MRVFAIVLTAVGLAACTRSSASSAPKPGPFSDDFNRAQLGPDWETNNPGAYSIVNGQLHFKLAHNQPLWLKRPLPFDVRIDFDCGSPDPAIDTKVEVWGDGHSHESEADVIADRQYTASGYVFIFGGWHNRLSTIVRQFEHEWQYQRGIPTRADWHAEPGRMYHWTILRKGGHLEWDIDGLPFLTRDDPNPLGGPGHDRFAFDGWESEVTCDNLKIQPL